MDEKIQKLKRDGRNYSFEGCLRLLQIVGKNNIVKPINYHLDYNSIQRLQNLLEELDIQNDEIIAPTLRKLMIEITDTFDITMTSDNESVRKLKNYLDTSNQRMKKQIIDFLKTKGKFKTKEIKHFELFLQNLNDWNSTSSSTSSSSINNGSGEGEGEGIGINIVDDSMYNSIHFLQNNIWMIGKVFPSMILNQENHSFIPNKYWGLSRNHINDIKEFITNYYIKIQSFYGNKKLTKILQKIPDKTKNIILLSIETPAFSEIKHKNKIIYSIFDRRTSTLLNEYYLLQVFTSYIELTNNPLMIKKMVVDTDNDNEYDFDIEGQIINQPNINITSEKDFIQGDTNELKENIAKLLGTFLEMMEKSKSMINITPQQIRDKVYKLKEREKETFTDRLKDLTDEQRNVDTILKINKLGVWGKGLTKGLKEYNPENYDEERDVMTKIAEIEKRVRRENSNISEDNIDLFMEEYIEDVQIEQQINEEENDLYIMNEDYMDGFPIDEMEDIENSEYF
jgi:hypothetical protein